MGTSFFASKGPADRSQNDGWTFGKLTVDVTGTSAVHLLTVLGLTNPVELAEGGEMTPTEMLLRLSVVQAEGGAELAQRRFGEWHIPGYFAQRLDQLAEVAREAEQIGGEVVWC
jgi:hypothetical protein